VPGTCSYSKRLNGAKVTVSSSTRWMLAGGGVVEFFFQPRDSAGGLNTTRRPWPRDPQGLLSPAQFRQRRSAVRQSARCS
jgi:hypothetical protein